MSNLKAEILDFLQQEPESSKSAVRRAVSAKSSRVGSALEELEEAGRIENRGNRYRHRWIVVEDSGSSLGEPPEALSAAFPAEVADVEVAYWATPSQAARILDTTTRTLSRWEDRGLPSARDGQELRYPTPHVVLWRTWWGIAKSENDGSRPTQLSIELALSRERTSRLEEWGESEI